MDDKTIAWMRKRLEEADSLTRQIAERNRTRHDVMEYDTALCARSESGNYYHVCPIPDGARDIIVAQIDARIEDLKKKLAEL